MTIIHHHSSTTQDYAFRSGNVQLTIIYTLISDTHLDLDDTVWCLCAAGYLSEVLKIQGPFLVVVPLSTVPNWIKEFRKWTPQLNALVYVGDSKSREVIRTYEFYNHRGASRPYRFEVLLLLSSPVPLLLLLLMFLFFFFFFFFLPLLFLFFSFFHPWELYNYRGASRPYRF